MPTAAMLESSQPPPSAFTSNTEVTLFKSNGIASWDLAVAMRVYAAAREKKLGRELPFWSDSAV